MHSILIGNGLNIQFSGYTYMSASIISRALATLRTGKVPEHVYPKDVANWLKLLREEFPRVMSGENDEYVKTSNDKKALAEFKQRYFNQKIKNISDIGFEDYFMIHNIFCFKNNIENPEMWDFREFLKRAFLDSIYNDGKLLKLYKKFPASLIQFFDGFDSIFTTNYDNNIEISLSGRKTVNYLHGAFHILDELYDPHSFRNQMPDIDFEELNVNKKYLHLYSNALSYTTGADKEFLMTMHEKANSVINKFVEAYENNSDVRKEIDSWENSNDRIALNFNKATMKKRENSACEFKEYYPVEKFINIAGSLAIFGLSPYNDSHLFNWINKNKSLDSVIFYYYDEKEKTSVEGLLPDKIIEFECAKKFWKELLANDAGHR